MARLLLRRLQEVANLFLLYVGWVRAWHRVSWFKKNVRLWEFESELESRKRGARLLRSLSGVARTVADSLEFEDIASEKGVENILKKLAFQGRLNAPFTAPLGATKNPSRST